MFGKAIDFSVDSPYITLSKFVAKSQSENCFGSRYIELHKFAEECKNWLTFNIIKLDVAKKAFDNHIAKNLLQHQIHIDLYIDLS